MFINVQILTNATRTSKQYDDETTIRNICEENDISYATGSPYLDGAPLRAGDYDKTLKDFGITEKCSLSNLVKESAAR